MAVKDVVLFFHAMPPGEVDWQGRPLKSFFKTPPVFVDCGSGRSMKCADPKEVQQTKGPKCPKSGIGWKAWMSRYLTSVPRASSDPAYDPKDVKTHVRRSVLKNLAVANSGGQLSNSDSMRICLVGFSEGCQAIKALLSVAKGSLGMDALYIDSVLAIDGIHTERPQYKGDDGKDRFCPPICQTTDMGGCVAFANLAAWTSSPGDQPTRLMVVTNSSTAPPRCCYSTQWTSDYIFRNTIAGISANTAPRLPDGVWNMPHQPPLVLPKWTADWGGGPPTTYTQTHNKSYAGTGNLWILGYNNIDTAGSGHNDHVYQSKVIMPLMLEKFLAPRWNSMRPEDAVLIGV